MAELFGQGFTRFQAITKSDTVNFDGSVSTYGQGVVPCDAFYVGTKGSTGTVVGITQSGVAVTFVGCIPGTIYPVRLIRVNSATTDASDMLACYLA